MTGDPAMSRLGDHHLDYALDESWPRDARPHQTAALPCLARLVGVAVVFPRAATRGCKPSSRLWRPWTMQLHARRAFTRS